jgi:AraC-like DNA-binding protein
LYDLDVDAEPFPARCHVEAWSPGVPGIREVFHAHLVDYAYPRHCHDTWAVLIVDDGAIQYRLDRRESHAAGQAVVLLPPGVAHDGRPAPGVPGFRKRELYLDETFLPGGLTGAAIDQTAIVDLPLRAALAGLHDRLLRHPPDSLGVQAGLALIGERITSRLAGVPRRPGFPDARVARRLRELLDAHITGPMSLESAAAALGRSVPHVVRSFTREFGLSPHAYVTGRRIDMARSLLLQGAAPAGVAAMVGFYDQAHFTRNFKKHTSATPASYARSHIQRSPGARPPPVSSARRGP